MTIQYKNAGFTLADTAATSVLTAPSNARLLIKQIQAVDIITNTLVLEEGDILKMTAETGAKISGVISYAQLDRSQENG